MGYWTAWVDERNRQGEKHLFTVFRSPGGSSRKAPSSCPGYSASQFEHMLESSAGGLRGPRVLLE